MRAQSGRALTVILIHHENKGGTVSGAWEGAGDTLLHVEARGNGYTSVHIQKARWSSTHHNTTLDLAWTDGEGFRLKEARTSAQRSALLTDGKWRTAKEIAAPSDAERSRGSARTSTASRTCSRRIRSGSRVAPARQRKRSGGVQSGPLATDSDP